MKYLMCWALNNMKLYATLEADHGRNARVTRKGGNSCLEIELSAFGKRIGEIYLTIETDADGNDNQYLLTFLGWKAENHAIIAEGHRHEGLIQRIKA